FYNVAQRTLEGLIGQIFLRNPNIEVPNRLNIVKADVDGAGVTAVQQAKLACEYALGYSRAGLYVDYPKTEKATSVADLESGNIRPNIAVYHPERIRNWDYIKVGAKQKLSLVVLDEDYRKEAADRFTREIAIQQRCLILENNAYKVEIWRDGVLFDTI